MIFGFNTDVKFGNTVYHVQSEARHNERLLQSQIFVKGRCIGKRATPYGEKPEVEQTGSEEELHQRLKEQHRRLVEAVRAGRIEEELDAEPAVASPAATVVSAPAATPASTPAPSSLAAEAAAAATVAAPLDELLAELRASSTVSTEAAPQDEQLATQFAAAVPDEPAVPGWTLAPLSGVIGKGLLVECLPPVCAADNSAVIVAVQVAEEAGAPAAGAQITCRITSGKGPATYAYTTTGASGIADLRLALAGLSLAETGLLVQASYRGKSASRKYGLRRSG